MKMKRGVLVARRDTTEKGQGMVEYGMILVFMALVIIVILATMGPKLHQMYGSVILFFQDTDVGFRYTVARSGPDQVVYTVTVNKPVTFTLTHPGTGQSFNATCAGTCTYSFTVPNSAGEVIITGYGSTIALPYPPKT